MWSCGHAGRQGADGGLARWAGGVLEAAGGQAGTPGDGGEGPRIAMTALSERADHSGHRAAPDPAAPDPAAPDREPAAPSPRDPLRPDRRRAARASGHRTAGTTALGGFGRPQGPSAGPSRLSPGTALGCRDLAAPGYSARRRAHRPPPGRGDRDRGDRDRGDRGAITSHGYARSDAGVGVDVECRRRAVLGDLGGERHCR